MAWGKRRSPRPSAPPASAGLPAPGPLRRAAPISTGRAMRPVPRHRRQLRISRHACPPQPSSQANNPSHRQFARRLLNDCSGTGPSHLPIATGARDDVRHCFFFPRNRATQIAIRLYVRAMSARRRYVGVASDSVARKSLKCVGASKPDYPERRFLGLDRGKHRAPAALLRCSS